MAPNTPPSRHRSDREPDDGTPWVEQYWIDGHYRSGDDPAVVVFGDDDTYAEYWDGDQIVRRDGTLGRVRLHTTGAVPEDAGDTHSDVNYIWAEIERIWHRSCLGLRMQPDICFYFSRGQSRENIDRLLAYFPCRDEVVDRIHSHMNFTRSAYPDVDEVTAAVRHWCETLITQAEAMELGDEATKIRELLDNEDFEDLMYRDVQTVFHEDARDYDNMPVALVIDELVSDRLYERPDHMQSYGYTHGRSMLREACYQISTWYQLANSLLTPMLVRDFGFDAWADVYRMGAIVHITDDAIMIGHPDPNDQSAGLTITSPTTGVTSRLHPG